MSVARAADDRVVARDDAIDDVVTAAAVDRVVPRAADDRVVAGRRSIDDVVTAAAVDRVVPGAADDRVVAGRRSINDVVTAAAVDRVVPRATDDRVVSGRRSIDDVVTTAAVDRVVARATDDRVVARRRSIDDVVAGAADQGAVDAVGGGKGVVPGAGDHLLECALQKHDVTCAIDRLNRLAAEVERDVLRRLAEIDRVDARRGHQRGIVAQDEHEVGVARRPFEVIVPLDADERVVAGAADQGVRSAGAADQLDRGCQGRGGLDDVGCARA